MRARDAPHRGQAEAGAARRGGEKRVEDATEALFADTATVVSHFDNGFFP